MERISVRINSTIAKEFPLAIMTALEKACQLVENRAVDNCPVNDGQLQASITHKVEQNGNTFTGAVGSNLEHAPYVHEGTGLYAREGNGRKNVPWTYGDAEGEFHSTKGQNPNPFLQKAIDESMNDIMQCFEECI